MQKELFGKFVRISLLICITSVLANLSFFIITKALGGQYSIPFTDPPLIRIQVSATMVILASLIPALLGCSIYLLLFKVSPRNNLPAFISVFITALLVSFGGPLELPGVELKTRLLLACMHLITATIILVGILHFHFRIKGSSQP